MKETMTIENVSVWLDDLRRDGWRHVAPFFGTENEFCSCPEFGKPCATIDWTAEFVGNGKED